MNTQQKGQRATEVQSDPFIQEVIEDMKKAVHALWETTADGRQRRELWYHLQGINRFERTLQTYIDNATMENQ